MHEGGIGPRQYTLSFALTSESENSASYYEVNRHYESYVLIAFCMSL